MLVMEPQTFLAESPTQFGLTPSPDGVLRGNALLNYGMGRMGADFSYPATETFESHIDRLVQLHEAIRPARNDEWPAAQAVGTSEAKSLRSIRFHPWVRVLPDPQAPCNDESIILADLAWQRLFRVHSSVVKDSGQLGTALTLVVPATDDSSVWREVLELGLGEPC
jgi:hypothetical protein